MIPSHLWQLHKQDVQEPSDIDAYFIIEQWKTCGSSLQSIGDCRKNSMLPTFLTFENKTVFLLQIT